MSSSSYSSYKPEIVTEKKVHQYVLRCPYSKCNSRIIKPASESNVKEIDIEIEFIKPTEESQSDNKFLIVNDVWDFDNIGVSKNFDNSHDIERLIICSDCDRGPLGFAKFDEGSDKEVKNLRYYLNLGSVVYQEDI